MRKIKQTERAYVIRYYTAGTKCLFDSALTLEQAKLRIAERIAKRGCESALVFWRGKMVYDALHKD